jgi:23S rRNA pseudouridine955/2504/2580 synthase/23S rRNA pseudouridine1911/1915/1917 synthase
MTNPPGLEILHADDAVLILNKSAGIPVLADGWDRNAPYLVKLLEAEYGKIWVVHRLDKVTSGVMVFARTALAHRDLNGQFENREAQKVYHAIAVGVPEWDQQVATHPLRANVGHKHRAVVDPQTGKPSETRFTVLKRYPAHALLEAKPVTGRTHQVRVHAMALGHPLLADSLYGAPPTDLCPRPALHAYSLTVRLAGGTPVTFTASYPEDLTSTLERLDV